MDKGSHKFGRARGAQWKKTPEMTTEHRNILP